MRFPTPPAWALLIVFGLSALVGCDEATASKASTASQEDDEAEREAAARKKQRQDEERKKEQEQKAIADAERAVGLIPKLYVSRSERETSKELTAIGEPAIKPLGAALKKHLAGYAAGGSGSKEEATKTLAHVRHANTIIEILLAIGDGGRAMAKKALDEVPAAEQKRVADMFRARHQLFD